MSPQTDQIARDIANHALAAIEQHEAVCEQRAISANDWREQAAESLQRVESSIRNHIKTVDEQFRGVYWRLWWAMGGMMAGMFTIIVILIEGRLHG